MSSLKARLQKLEELRKKPLVRSFVRAGNRYIGGRIRHNGKQAGFLRVPIFNEEQWMEAAAAEMERVALRNVEDVQKEAEAT